MRNSLKRIVLYAVLMCGISIVLTGCGTGFPTGLIYTDVTLPVYSTSDPTIQDYNVGKASCTKWFGIIAVGDASIGTALQNGTAGPISKVQRIEYHALDICGCGIFTTIVYGEATVK